MDMEGSKCNKIDNVKVSQTEVEILKKVRRKFVLEENKLKEEKNTEVFSKNEVWDTSILYNGKSLTLGNYLIHNQIIPFTKMSYNQANTVKQLACFDDEN